MRNSIGIKEGMKVLDAGCGVGGPARNIAAYTKAKITGITINEYQVRLSVCLSVFFCLGFFSLFSNPSCAVIFLWHVHISF